MKAWLKGLLAAIVGGAVSSTAQVLTTGTAKPAALKTAAISGAALTVGAYLTKSPLDGQSNIGPETH